MKIAVLGTGIVGNTIGSKLIELGHEVKMGSRTANNEKASKWVQSVEGKASQGTFAEAASFGEIIFTCTKGDATLAALEAAGAENLQGKIVIDITNPLDFSKGMPPTLFVSNTDSLGEQVQRKFPEAKVIKTLNTMAASLMVNPASLPGDHDVFISGNDAQAKAQVTDILKDWFGWKSIIDLGDISTARCTEQLLPIWVRLYINGQNPYFNFKVVR